MLEALESFATTIQSKFSAVVADGQEDQLRRPVDELLEFPRLSLREDEAMKITIAAFVLAAAMSTQAMAYDYGLEDDWQRRRDVSEMQRIDQAVRYRQMELNDRMQQLERRERVEKSDNDWRQRQLEAENYRSEWR